MRLVGWSISAAIALIVLAYVALPGLLRYGLPHALAPYGVVSSVEGARVSLANERVTLVGFQVGRAGGPAIRWGEVTARVDMTELLKGNIRIIDFQVKDARVDLAQLQASEWKPPDRAAAIPDLRKLNIDIGEVVLRDLEFIGLSELIGRKVELRSLSVGSLSHLEAGARVAFHLEGLVGKGSLRLAGQARMVENLPVFEGRFELSALDLRGFGRLLGLAEPTSVGGTADGDGTFGLAYVQGEGAVRADLSGSAGFDGLELDAGGTRITRTTAQWNGDAEVFWPVAGGPPRFISRGSVTSSALEAAQGSTTAPYGILVRGFQWSGEIRHASELETEGRLSGDLLRIDTGREGESRLEMELSRFSTDCRYRSGGDRYEFEAGKLTAETAKVAQALDRGLHSLVAHRVVLEKVRLGSAGHHIGSLETESVEATETETAEVTASRSARLISLIASGIEIRAGQGTLIDQLEVEHAGFDSHEVSIDLGRARARSVETGVEAPFKARALTAASLRQGNGVVETWGSNLSFSSAAVSASGEVFSDVAVAESLSQAISGDPLWEASAVHAQRLSIGSRRIEASNLGTDRFAYGRFGETLIEIESGEGSNFSVQYDMGIDAGTVKLGSMRYRSGGSGLLEFALAELNETEITFQGGLSAKRIDADSARYTDANAGVLLVEALKLGELSGRFPDGLRIDAAHAARVVHDRAAGADYEATGLELSRIELSGASETSAVAGRLDSLEAALTDGARLILQDVAVAHPAGNAAGKLAADGGRVRIFSYSTPDERILQFLNIEIGAVGGNDNDGYRVGSLSASGATASDAVVKAELETGAIQVGAATISARSGLRADLVSANEVSLAEFDGKPSATFGGGRISLSTVAFEKGESVRLGEILLDDASLTLGLDDQGEFVLPALPFFSRDGEPSVGFIIERLETRTPARLSFFDSSTAPPFEAVISPLRARLENYDGNDPGQRAKFMLEGRMDELSHLKATGEFSIERDALNLEVSGKVSAFELNRLNMYAAKHSKGAIRSGRGDAAFDIEIRGRKLSGTIRFVFSKVKFERAEASSPTDGESRAELSLQNSFAMLKDKDGIVRLTVPLSGSLDDPRFDFSDGLVQALVKTLRSTVTLTFKPLGLLVGAAGLVGASQELEFSPVAFDPGEWTLSGEGLAHLDALARELERHPAVKVRICGRAVSADRIRIEQGDRRVPSGEQPPADQKASRPADVNLRLADLAEQRASAVRRYLEESKRIARERLMGCEARVESTPGRLPRVDLPVRVETESNAVSAEESRG